LGHGSKTVCSQEDCDRVYVTTTTAAGDVAITSRTSSLVGVRRSQRNPDAEEPEAPIVEIRVEEWLHPVAVVVEGLVIEPALVDSAPPEVGRRWRRRSTRVAEV
jgi:hypothetical protein